MFSGSLKGLKMGGSISIDDASASGAGFKTGGRVKKTGKALVHSGEYVLAKSIPPTAEQKRLTRELKKKSKANTGT
jgi:hypothetical protein